MADLKPAGPSGLRGIFGAAGVLLGGRGVNAVLSLAFIAVAARVLGPRDFGLLALVTAFAAAVGGVVTFQSWQAILHYGTAPLAAGRIGDLQRVIRFSFALDVVSGLVGASLGAAGALLFARALGWPVDLAPAAAAYATVTVFAITSTAVGVLRLYGRFDLLAAESVVGTLIRLSGALLAWRFGGGLTAFLIVAYLAEIVSFLYLYGASWRELRRRGHAEGFRWTGGGWAMGFPGLWRFVGITNLNTTLQLAFTHVGVLFVGAALGPADAGLYRVAKQVGDAMAKPAKLLTAALYPELARLWAAGEVQALHQLTWRLALAAGGFATVLLVLAAVGGGPVLALLMGETYRSAAGVMVWLVAAAAVGLWALPLEPLLISTGRAGSVLLVRLIASAAYLAAIWPLLMRVGLNGGGAAVLGAATLMAAGMLAWVWRGRGPTSGPPQ